MAAICKSTLVARHNAILAQGHQASINVGPCAGELLIILQTITSTLWINDTVIPNVCLLCCWTHTPKKWWSSPFLPPPLPFLIPPFSFAGLLVPPHLPRTPASSSCQLLCPITNWHAIRIRLPRRPTSVMSFRSHWWKSQSHNVAQFPNYLFSPRAAFLTPLESVSVFICSSISVFYPREGGKKKLILFHCYGLTIFDKGEQTCSLTHSALVILSPSFANFRWLFVLVHVRTL